MANRIKGITVEINGDTTGLNTALKNVNSNIKTTESKLKDIEKLLKLDPTNTELLAQKQQALKDAVSDTSEKLKTLKDAAANVSPESIGQEKFDALNREIAETESKLKTAETELKNFGTVGTQQAAAVGAKMQEVGDKISTVGDKMSSIGSGLTKTVTLPIAAAGTAAVKTAADFESSMSQVQATMGIAKDATSDLNGESVNTMDALRDLAKEMGSKTAFSASECAEALNYLALAGYNTQQMADTLPTVLNLAAAGGMDLASASDMVTDAMSALGLEVSESDVMVDQMAKTASSTNTSVAQLGEAMLTIGATGKSVSGGTAELSTALGILANNGIKGAEGGTHLRNILLSLQKPTDKAAASLAELGVDVYDSEGHMRSMNDVLGDLNASMDGMTDAEKTNIIGNIFNKTDLAAAQALLAGTGAEWNNLQGSITESGGAAQQMADTQLDNLEGKLTILKSSLEGLLITVGEKLMPLIDPIVEKIQNLITYLSNLDEEDQKQILTIAGIVAAVGPVLMVLGKVISFGGSIISGVGKFMTLLPKLQGMLAGISAPVLIVVGVVALLVAAFKHLWDTNEEFREKITEIWEGIKSKFEEFTQGIVDRLNSLGFDFENFSEVVSAIWDGFCNLLAPVFEGAFNIISTVFDTVLDTLLNVLDFFIALFTGDWDGAWEAIKNFFTDIWDGIVGIFEAIWETLKGILDTVLGWFGTSWEEAWNGIKEFFTKIWNGIKEFFTGIWNGIKTIFTTAVDGIKTKVTTVFDTIKTKVTTIFENLKTKVKTIWEGIKTAITTPIENAKTTISGIVDKIKGFFTGLKIELPHIKLPHFSVTGELSLSPPSVPHLNIDWYKEGGIMTRPTLFGLNGTSLMAGGEAGAEAILPLSKFYTKLTDILDRRLSGNGNMEKYLAVIADNSSKGIYLQDGTLVGAILPEIDAGLAKYSLKAGRGSR